MTIWLVLALMTAAAVLAVLWPLSRRGEEVGESVGETQFYREQLAEIVRDVDRGLIAPTEAEAAKAEAGRRLLRASATAATRRGAPVGEPALRRRRAVSALVLSTVPLLALAVYGAYGSPTLPGQPLAARVPAEDPAQMDFATALQRIEAHLAQNPDDGRGWEVLAPVYLRSGRKEEAARAFGNAARLLGPTAVRLASFGEALVTAGEGIVSAEARAAFEQALKLDAADPRARYYLALAAEQDGRVAEARAAYESLVAASPPEAGWVPLVRERLAGLPGGPGAEAVAALPAGEQLAAIRGMVEGLAARLERGGGTLDEWSRLVRSHTVLGERDKAQAALARSRLALAQDQAALADLAILARDLGLASDVTP